MTIGKAQNMQHTESGTDTAVQCREKPLRLVIAGGGTGGHLFPGIAVGQAVMARNADNAVLFVSVGNAFEKRALGTAGFPLSCITSAALKGQGVWDGVKGLFKLPKGVFESIVILKQTRPDLVLGLGSYTSAPVVLGAWLMGMSIGLHEQNILPGLTNRMLAVFADRIFVSFENTRFAKHRWRQQRLDRKIIKTGNPVRREIVQAAADKGRTPGMNGQGRFTVLILGGSQGAHRINTAMMVACRRIREKKNFFFIHQTGQKDREATETAYKENGLACEVAPFFDDMASKYRQADLVVCRAGATTVAEVTALGKASLFIPYPYAADDHQAVNARNMVRESAADMILEKELSGEMLFQRLAYYAAHRQVLSAMAANAKRFGRPDAAERIVDGCYDMVSSKTRKIKNE